MRPVGTRLNIYRGDSYRWRFRLWMGRKGWRPYDLTGVTAKSEIRNRPRGTVLAALDCAVTLPNVIDVVLTAASSRRLPVKGVWDLQLTFAGGDVLTLAGGDVSVKADVTDSNRHHDYHHQHQWLQQ